MLGLLSIAFVYFILGAAVIAGAWDNTKNFKKHNLKILIRSGALAIWFTPWISFSADQYTSALFMLFFGKKESILVILLTWVTIFLLARQEGWWAVKTNQQPSVE